MNKDYKFINNLQSCEKTLIIDPLENFFNDKINILTDEKNLCNIDYENNPTFVITSVRDILNLKDKDSNQIDSELNLINENIYTSLNSINTEESKTNELENKLNHNSMIVIDVRNENLKENKKFKTNNHELMKKNADFIEEVPVFLHYKNSDELNKSTETTYSSIQTTHKDNNKYKSNKKIYEPHTQLPNNNNHGNLRERFEKRKRKIKSNLFIQKKSKSNNYKSKTNLIQKTKNKVNIKITEKKSKVIIQAEKKFIDKNLSDSKSRKIFIKPVTPNYKRQNKYCNNNKKQNLIQSNSEQLVLEKNLTNEKKLVLNSNYATISPSDNEFEKICEFIKNENYNPVQLSHDTLDLLNELSEFQDIDQSTNEKLLADLLSSPEKSTNDYQKNNKMMNISTPIINKYFKDNMALSLCSNSETIGAEYSEMEIKIEEHEISLIPSDNEITTSEKSISVKNNPIITDYQNFNKLIPNINNENNHNEDESNYNDTNDDSDDSCSQIDIDDIKRKADTVGKSFIIKKRLIEKMRTFKVNLDHEVPIQHQLEKAICTPPNAKFILLFEKYAPFTKGFYLKNEDDIIKKNWQHFCEIHNWCPSNVKLFLQLRYKGRPILLPSEAIKFAQFLAKGLPSRSLYSVMSRFRRIYRKDTDKKLQSKKNYYTSEEDRIIWEYFKDKNISSRDKVRKIAKLLNRPMSSINYRIQKLRKEKMKKLPLSKKDLKKAVNWNIHLVEKFIKQLMTLTLCKDIRELKNATIPLIIWEILEKKFKISKIVLQNFWIFKLHTQLFYQKPFFINDIKVLLIEYMYIKGITDRTELNWQEIREYFDGITIKYLMKIFNNLVTDYNHLNKSTLGDTIQWLYENKINQLKWLRQEQYLPRLIYKDEKIVVID